MVQDQGPRFWTLSPRSRKQPGHDDDAPKLSPPVVDLTSTGFPLVGGRLDYLSGQVVAALVYRRREHVINVFVAPGLGEGAQPASRSEDMFREGYHVLHWTEGGMAFWAVS